MEKEVSVTVNSKILELRSWGERTVYATEKVFRLLGFGSNK